MNRLAIMVLFLTRIPLPFKVDYNEEEMAKGIKYMPLVGLLIGSLLYGLSYGMGIFDFDRGVVNVSVWLLYLGITGGLHIDGLADTFDGIYSNRDRDRVLEIMKDSHIGAFGVLGIIAVMGFGIVNSHYLPETAYLVFPIVGRSVSLLVSGRNIYARPDGMGKVFVDRCGNLEMAVGTISSSAVAAYFFGLPGLIGLFFSAAITLAMAKKVSSTIGGITGDTIGCSIELSQATFLFGLYSATKIMAFLS